MFEQRVSADARIAEDELRPSESMVPNTNAALAPV
jgi:hypothetical protein